MEEKELALQDLSLNQLVNIKTQLEQETTLFKGSFSQLRIAQQKFTSCVECVEKLEKNIDYSKECMIPVTNSLFFKGNILDTQR